MLRRRFDVNVDKEFEYKNLIDTPIKTSIHSVSSVFAVILIIAGVLIFDVIVKSSNTVPSPLKIADENNHPHDFIAERAQNHLQQLVSIGQKITGSYENEVLAVDFLKREINFIFQQANHNQKIELDHQTVSGSYFLDFKPYGLVNIYENVQNVIVRIASAKNYNDSLLINCHFDSVPSSPGGSDDGINCVAMLETIRVLSKETERPLHNIIFLFNGAEENPLQAAHGFITQHKWAKECRAVINLEAGGAGGREILFQAGPGNDFLINNYVKHVPHPFAQSTGEEIFQSNLIPSDTDFRLFRDFGNIPGLDFAYARNGYVYHTKYDGFDNIEDGTYQHVGDNLLALVRGLSASPQLSGATLTSKEKTVYFDLMGYYMIAYSEKTAVIINLVVVTISSLIFIKCMLNLKNWSIIDLILDLFYSGAAQVMGWGVSLAFTILIAFMMDHFDLTMSWYTRPKIIFGLYFCPTLIFSSIFLILVNQLEERYENLNLGSRTQLHGHTLRMIWTFFLFVSTFFIVRSSYVFLFPVLFNTISFLFINLLKLDYTRRTWLYIYLASLIIPILFAMFLSSLLLQIFIPITGRFGSDKNPDLIIGCLSAILCIFISSFIIPLVTLLRKPQTVIIGLMMTFLITLGCIGFTQYGFPYSGDSDAPSPQRYWIFHTSREFHNESGAIIKKDSGYFLLNMDRNSPNIIKQYVPEIEDAIPLTNDCDKELFCGLPIWTSRMLSIYKESTWIPAPPPVVHEPVNLKLLSKTAMSPTIMRYHFQAVGPDHYSIFLSPKFNLKVVQWSFIEEIPQNVYISNGRPVYFILYGYGLMPSNPYTFWIDMETPVGWNHSVMDIVISGKYVHHEKTRTKHYQDFLNKFPAWAHLTAWMTNYHSWIY